MSSRWHPSSSWWTREQATIVSSAFEKKDRRIYFERTGTSITHSKTQKRSSLLCLLFRYCRFCVFCSALPPALIQHDCGGERMSEPRLLSDQCDRTLISRISTEHNVRSRNKETDIGADQLPISPSRLGNVARSKLEMASSQTGIAAESTRRTASFAGPNVHYCPFVVLIWSSTDLHQDKAGLTLNPSSQLNLYHTVTST